MDRIRYRDRIEAGKHLAELLGAYAGRRDVVVLALPRGGVPVAFEVAHALHLPLDVFLVRKLGVPHQEELAMGAIASGGMCVFNEEIVQRLGIPRYAIESAIAREQQELIRREQLYRGDRKFPDVQDRTVILIDDGLATGATMRAAVRALRVKKPTRIVVAVPVSALSTCAELGNEVDEMICARTPEPFFGVGAWYENFDQTSDQEVHDLLAQSEREMAATVQEKSL